MNRLLVENNRFIISAYICVFKNDKLGLFMVLW